MINTKIVGMLVAAFVAGSFVASPELRAYAANTVFSTDIVDGEVKTADLANNAVTAGKIKDAEVKAAEIATDAVGGSELQGVTKLLFGQCDLDSTEAGSNIAPGGLITVQCNISGVDSDDSATATMVSGVSCFAVTKAAPSTGVVSVSIRNICVVSFAPGAGSSLAVIVYDK